VGAAVAERLAVVRWQVCCARALLRRRYLQVCKHTMRSSRSKIRAAVRAAAPRHGVVLHVCCAALRCAAAEAVREPSSAAVGGQLSSAKSSESLPQCGYRTDRLQTTGGRNAADVVVAQSTHRVRGKPTVRAKLSAGNSALPCAAATSSRAVQWAARSPRPTRLPRSTGTLVHLPMAAVRCVC
jgi:hypothetical protein